MTDSPTVASRKRGLTKGAWIGLAAILIFVAFMAWNLLVPHVYESSGPMTVAEARRHSPIELPASAKNIRVATYRHWIAYLSYVRFECPPADAEAHAKKLLPDEKGRDLSVDELEWLKVPSSQARNPDGVFRDVSWFDLRNIEQGKQFGEAGPGKAKILVDRNRGVFFYSITD